MELDNLSNKIKHIKSKNMLEIIRSNVILRKINGNLHIKRALELFIYNKKLQNRL